MTSLGWPASDTGNKWKPRKAVGPWPLLHKPRAPAWLLTIYVLVQTVCELKSFLLGPTLVQLITEWAMCNSFLQQQPSPQILPRNWPRDRRFVRFGHKHTQDLSAQVTHGCERPDEKCWGNRRNRGAVPALWWGKMWWWRQGGGGNSHEP